MNGYPTVKHSGIELIKEVNSLLYVLTGDLYIMYDDDCLEEIERCLINPNLVVIHTNTNESLWDGELTKPQLDFFKEELEDYE